MYGIGMLPEPFEVAFARQQDVCPDVGTKQVHHARGGGSPAAMHSQDKQGSRSLPLAA
jgi:hypothetical protein